MSNGVWVSSAWVAMRKMTKPTNCVRMNGLPMPPKPKISPSACACTMPCRLMRAGLDDDADHGQHQRQLVGDELAGGPQRRRCSEYLLADAQPAISTPMTDSDDTARAKKMPASRSSTTRRGPAGMTT